MGLCTAVAELEMQLLEESRAAERPVCRATKRAEEETNKVFRSGALRRGIAEGPGRDCSGVGRDARPRRQQPGHEAGLGSHRAEECALGFRKLTRRGAHPLPMTAPSWEPAPCSSPALQPMGAFFLPPGIIYRRVPTLERGVFSLGSLLPRLLARAGESRVFRGDARRGRRPPPPRTRAGDGVGRWGIE